PGASRARSRAAGGGAVGRTALHRAAGGSGGRLSVARCQKPEGPALPCGLSGGVASEGAGNATRTPIRRGGGLKWLLPGAGLEADRRARLSFSIVPLLGISARRWLSSRW